jgi:hypothetical protein
MPVPAILIHEFHDEGAIWAPVVADLGPDAEAWLTPDLAGMGSLSVGAGPHTLPRYAAEITRLTDAEIYRHHSRRQRPAIKRDGR